MRASATDDGMSVWNDKTIVEDESQPFLLGGIR